MLSFLRNCVVEETLRVYPLTPRQGEAGPTPLPPRAWQDPLFKVTRRDRLPGGPRD